MRSCHRGMRAAIGFLCATTTTERCGRMGRNEVIPDLRVSVAYLVPDLCLRMSGCLMHARHW